MSGDPLGGGLSPRDTLTVVGGQRLTRVDADAVLGAAALVADVADALRSAALSCSAVAGDLHRSTWVPVLTAPPFGRRLEPWEVAARLRAAELARQAAERLARRGERAEQIALRLRLAAGLYRRSGSVVEQMVSARVAGTLAVVGRFVDGVVLPPVHLAAAVSGWVLPETASSGVPAPPAWGAALPPATREVTGAGGPGAVVWRGLSPYADEVVAGLAWGVDPFGGLTGSAGELAGLVHAAMPDTTVEVLEVATQDSGTGPPAWADRPSGTVAEALARTADLYPHGSGIVGRPGTGAPPGTVAVEEVTHDDGTTSWTVLVPGTQQLLSTTHPFDGLTDLQLMAHQAADVTDAVNQALEQAGAAPDEPVVLVGHSLGGIAAVALASSPAFRSRHPVGGVVTAGTPSATFTTPRGVPVLHLENDEELVSPADGRSSAQNPGTRDRVTVGRALRASADRADRAASGSLSLAHAMPTHLRTLAAAQASQNVQVAGVVERLEGLLDGRSAQTRFYAARRVGDPGVVMAPGPDGVGAPVSPSSGRTPR
ncbi:GPI inositol-deacylase [Isoptericola sp. NEAU-Y5]|uniref:GPI inositol-deacylase n=1 Tax=Isoptericola luteus TaxID=2879484 RepID=A0ABS7ZBS0_9MICO|nr:GPI inositol-deacylase [Isoptericola sp. NEAU-Y5]MCA5891912.1 GPI inositol-deacylase [Isoptericola sp. NEAU-Y5]